MCKEKCGLISGEHVPFDGVKFNALMAKVIALLIIVVLASAYCVPTRADVFFEAGQSTYTKPPDKLWHQESGGFPSDDQMDGSYYRIGWEKNFSKHWSGRASVFDLGKYSQNAITGNEPCFDAYGANAYAMCPLEYREGYYTQGNIGGLALTAMVHSDLKKPFAFTFEFGPTYVKQSFWLQQSNWPGHTHIQRAYGIGYMVSPGIRLNGFTVNFVYYNSNVGANSKDANAEQIGTGEVKVIAAGYVF